ncbi:MAG: alpha/beta hydrolase [Bryobacteraceae bacterium]|nr:alpha/beta hydrolase [Bryobacteraceae bacterium]
MKSEAAILFLHGLTRRAETFAPITGTLGEHYHLHQHDFRGHGESPRRGPYHVTDYVQDALDFLDVVPQERVFVYGHSLGAMAAAAVAAMRPKRVTGVVLEDPPFHTMGDRIHDSPLGSYFTALRTLAGSPKPIGELARDLAELRYGPGNSIRCGDTRDATTLRFAASCLRRLDPTVLDPVAEGRWLDGYPVQEIFRGLRCPALVLQADPDRGGMLTNADATALEREAADATVVQVHAGHALHWAATQTTLAHVLAFLASFE